MDVWGRWAEAVRDSGMRKGQQLLVEGKLKTDEWNDRTSGAKRSAVTIVATQISTVRRWDGGGGGGGGQVRALSSPACGGQVCRFTET